MSQRNIFSAIDIRSDKIICLIAQELEIINRGKILQLIGIGISKYAFFIVYFKVYFQVFSSILFFASSLLEYIVS